MIRRHYIEIADGPTGTTEAQLSLAEALIDQYVGHQVKFLLGEYIGTISSLPGARKIIDTSSDSRLDVGLTNYFKDCVIEMISGPAIGEVKRITASEHSDKSVTYDSDFTGAIAVGDLFKIYQLGKFPRSKDIISKDDIIYKPIPLAVRDAVYAQVEFIIEMGDDYFTGEDSEVSSESIMSYSYSKGPNSNQIAKVKMVSPKARVLLRGIKNVLGQLNAENTSCL